MGSSYRNALCVAAVAGFGLSLPVPVLAADTQDATALEEIVVTARRVEERLQNVPISITVFKQQQLEDHNVSSAADLANFSPSLSVDARFGAEETSFALRGFFQEIATSPTVAVYFADAIGPRGGYGANTEHGGEGAGPGNLFDLQNVQVLNGPQGTLFGRNTTGGAVLLVPNKPTQDFEGYLELSVGNYDMERVQAVVNVPVNDKVRLRFGIDHESRTGYLNNVSGIGPSDFDDINYTAARISAVVNVTDDIENYTVATFMQSRHNGEIGQVVACNPTGQYATGSQVPFTAFIGGLACAQMARDAAGGRYAADNIDPGAFQYARQLQFINTTTWSVNDDLTLKNIASYAEWVQNAQTAIFGTDWIFPSTFGPLGGYRFGFVDTGPQGNGEPFSQQDTMTEELQAQGFALDGKLKYQGGVYIESSQPLGEAGVNATVLMHCDNPNALNCFDGVGALFSGAAGQTVTVGGLGPHMGETSYHDYGIFGQATYTITDELKFTGGVRWTYDIENAHAQRYNFNFPVGQSPTVICTVLAANPFIDPVTRLPIAVPASQISKLNGCTQGYHTSSRAPTWVMDLEYTPFEDVNTYVKYSRGYRSGGIKTNSADGYFTYQPETIDAYEVGVKTSFRGAVSGVFNVAGFYNDFSNQQLDTGFYSSHGAPATDGIVNAGSSRMYGVEVDATIVPYPGLSIAVGYSYLNTLLEKLAPITPIAGGLYDRPQALQVQGGPLELAPENKLTISPSYTLPLDQSVGKITIGASYTYTAKQLVAAGAPPPYQYIPSTGLVNLNVNWDSVYGLPVDAQFFMTNVFNKYYVNFLTDFYANVGFDMVNTGPPRMFGGRIKYRF